jgi:tetratricopeptide (TPR) repeat protein
MEPEETQEVATADFHLSRAYALEERDRFDDALVECDLAIEAARSVLAEAHNFRGIVLEDLGRNDEAMTAYFRALEIDPELEAARGNLAALEADLGISDEAVTLAAFLSASEAHIARTMLASAGIWSYVADEIAAAALGISSGFGGIRLQVRASDVPRAMEILGMEEKEEDEGQE